MADVAAVSVQQWPCLQVVSCLCHRSGHGGPAAARLQCSGPVAAARSVQCVMPAVVVTVATPVQRRPRAPVVPCLMAASRAARLLIRLGTALAATRKLQLAAFLLQLAAFLPQLGTGSAIKQGTLLAASAVGSRNRLAGPGRLGPAHRESDRFSQPGPVKVTRENFSKPSSFL